MTPESQARRYLLVVAVIFAIGALAFWLFWARVASAHDWYPDRCCHDKDCHPVSCDSISEVPGGYDWQGYHFASSKALISQDRTCHVCVHKSPVGTDYTPLCIFILPST